jgi:hypothetical protein
MSNQGKTRAALILGNPTEVEKLRSLLEERGLEAIVPRPEIAELAQRLLGDPRMRLERITIKDLKP